MLQAQCAAVQASLRDPFPKSNASKSTPACMCLQIDDPLDAIAVHAFNGTWGVWAVGFFAGKNLVNTSYGYNPFTSGDREYGCFLGGSGRLLAAQIVYSIWLARKLCSSLYIANDADIKTCCSLYDVL